EQVERRAEHGQPEQPEHDREDGPEGGGVPVVPAVCSELRHQCRHHRSSTFLLVRTVRCSATDTVRHIVWPEASALRPAEYRPLTPCPFTIGPVHHRARPPSGPLTAGAAVPPPGRQVVVLVEG